ncbi:MAG TPA: hypothetical protein VGD18_02485 [Thiobacillaceae bacterium]
MKLVATTVIRHSVVGQEATGQLLLIDWQRGEIERAMPVPLPKHPSSNDNPRGGLRGGRGVKFWQGHCYVANYDTVYVYDQAWQQIGEISHPLATDIHEIDIDSEGLWLSCSRYDLIIKLSFDGRLLAHWHISDAPGLMRELGIDVPPLPLDRDYRRHLPGGLDRTHLNCVQGQPDGSVIVHLGKVGPEDMLHRTLRRLLPPPGFEAHRMGRLRRRLYEWAHGSASYVVRLSGPELRDFSILARYPALRPNHNGQLLNDGRVGVASERKALVISEPGTGRTVHHVPLPAKWVRGLTQIAPERLLVGVAPCAVIEVDLTEGRIQRRVALSDHPHEALHGLAVVPPLAGATA